MKLSIVNVEIADPDMLNACIQRVRRFYQEPCDVEPEIWCDELDRDGFLDYGMRFPYPSGGQIIVHAIRRPGSTQVEFHS